MAEQAETRPESKTAKGRSPSYPGIDLATAIERAGRLYETQREHDATIPVILGRWGYKRSSGAGLVTLAALKKFGLLDDEGTGSARRAKLTAAALQIVRDRRPNSSQREVAIRKAALLPKIHREVWDRWAGSLPPDDEDVAYYLEQERGFTARGAKEFIEQFRRTISFAQLSPSDTLLDNDGDTGEEHDSGGDGGGPDPSKFKPPKVTPPGTVEVQIPLPTKPWATILLPESMTEETWAHMLRFFDFMKPSLVKPDTQEDEHEGYEK